MRFGLWTSVVAGFAVSAGLAGVSQAAVTITQGASAPSYENSITFDEVGGPTGPNVPGNSWISKGVTEIAAGTGPNDGYVGTAINLGSGNAYSGTFGVYFTFAQPITSLSIQWKDDSGPATFMGGGAIIVAQDAMGNDLQSLFINNPGAVGTNNWFNIVATGGSNFSKLVCTGFGNFPTSTVDNVSWSIPAPGSTALLGLGGLMAFRRRRA